jgi:4-amino-4-deoxy-L-arabinose transferase-like glycosyltransferase
MQTPQPDINKGDILHKERLVIFLICAAAALRVFLFSAAFPFFNNVDEQAHFDLVYKYSRGRLPSKALEKFDPEAAKIIAHNGTSEYFYEQGDKIPASEADSVASFFENNYNRETWSWPSYYLLAGLWCRIGIVLGLTNLGLLYWIRMLNVPLMVVLVVLSYKISRRIFSENRQCRIALPLMVAFFPQDIFFAITSDVLSPVVFALSFLMLLEIYTSEKSRLYHLLAGLVVAITFLTKASNIAIPALSVVVLLVKSKQALSQNRLKNYLPALVLFVFAAAIPAALWLVRNYITYGDIIGSAAVEKERAWTRKPITEMFNHPIFTPKGLLFFLTELTKTFWRGEYIWRTRRLSQPAADYFYVISSAILFIAAVISIIRNKSKADGYIRFALKAALFVVILSVMFLAFSSTRYDFGPCVYPSQAHPYFTSGRLIAGTIVPFLLLYITGLNYILSKLRLKNLLLIITIVIVAGIIISEIILTLPTFSSPCNLFHMK